MNQGSSGLKEPWSNAWRYVAFFYLAERPDRLWGSPGVIFHIKVAVAWSWPLTCVYSVEFKNECNWQFHVHAVMKQVGTNLSSRYTKEES